MNELSLERTMLPASSSWPKLLNTYRDPPYIIPSCPVSRINEERLGIMGIVTSVIFPANSALICSSMPLAESSELNAIVVPPGSIKRTILSITLIYSGFTAVLMSLFSVSRSPFPRSCLSENSSPP
jgi:Trk-type K+ transport system membrane component